MRFNQEGLLRFAAWSGDRNPLHVDPAAARGSFFGEPVVHGILSGLHALAVRPAQASPPRTLDIEFRGAVLTSGAYAVELEDHALTVRAGDQPVMRLETDRTDARAGTPDLSWVPAALASGTSLPGIRQRPAVLDAEDFARAIEVRGRYETAAPGVEYTADARLHPLQARVLGLCSYVIGMEIPGLRSLFTRLHLAFADDPTDAPVLLYRARTLRFDPHFRILDVGLDVVTDAGRFVATGELRCYVRFSPIVTDPARHRAWLSAEAARVAGRAILVCGGSRGLGAEITAALAISGAHVYPSYHRDSEAARELTAAIDAAGGRVSFLQGDAADPAWCARALETIVERHGRLDAVVLNACAPPAALRLGPESSRAYGEYVAANLPLAQVPLAACLGALAASGGTIVCVSSSFVDEPPPGFGHYVALKQAVEAMVSAAVREAPGVHALIVRPPRLQTTWNDTPTGVLGTIPASHAAAHIVNRLAVPEGAGATDVLTAFPPLRAPSPVETAAPEFFLGVTASFTCEPLLEGVAFWFRELGVRGQVDFAPYGQVLQTLLSPGAGLSGRPGMHVVMLRLRDWLRELAPGQAASVDFLRSHLGTAAQDVERALRAHRAQASADTLLVLCPSAPGHPDEAEVLLQETQSRLAAALGGIPGLAVVRAEDFHASYGVEDATIGDPFREHLAHIPYKAAYFHTLATIVMRHAHRKLVAPRKVVVVDCDNTLWRGVVGEVGAAGVEFGEGHAALHATLVRLAESGLLIALCSKNEEADVWRVFETRSDLVLRREQIVAAAINWQPKSVNLMAMAARLNLGLDSFVFIDDNPVECAEVRAACPEVLTLEWPLDEGRAMQLLRHVWELDVRGSTDEDQRRTELYRQEFHRQELQAEALTFSDFIASLQLAVDISPVGPDTLERASQLTLRTNQFNFTTKRRDRAELEALASAGTHHIRTVSVRDRFGDYGLVGLLIASVQDDELVADTFLLSCRVLGRGVEHRMLAELGSLAGTLGASSVRLRVVPTKRNTPARSFLQSVVAAEHRIDSDAGEEARLPASLAAVVTFEPPDQAPPAVAESGGSPAAGAIDTSRLRSREARIARTAFELATPSGLLAAIGGGPAGAAAASNDPADADFVYTAFATALNVSAGHVRAVDSLEALGCDSFKIVEITVKLLERFPGLPGTLLFEHRSVSEIAGRIARLASGGETIQAIDRQSTPTALSGRPTSDAGRDIAVVGMHLRTAGARSPEDLWALLSAGGVAVAPVPADRARFLGRLDDERRHFAGLLDEVARFDAELFGITPREAELMDPQLRLFLEVAWSALEDAGCLGRLEPDTGVFAGVMYGDYAARANVVSKQTGNPFKCWEGFSLANRVSQVFGFGGPSIAVDTACSSSGTAVHLACRALTAADCRVAVVGGVNLILDPDRFVQLGRLGILSESGRCLAFGADADGTVLGEGAGVVVLRPLADAIERGDRIYGVIKGTGVSTGSGTVGFTAPNPVAQAHAIRKAVRASGIDPRTVSYVETHGTGTALGDPIEVRGLTLAYGDPQLWDPGLTGRHDCTIGSIKPNIGHLEAGAGVLGLIKVLLQLERRTLLPSVTSEATNPQIPFADTPFSVQRELTTWERPSFVMSGGAMAVPRRAALNSFGVGGANAHIIVEEAPARVLDRHPERSHHLLAASAQTASALSRSLLELGLALEANPTLELADVCYSVNTGRRPLPHRMGIVARNRAEMAGVLRRLAAGEDAPGGIPGLVRGPGHGRVAFLFTGQGAQYAGMGRELYESQPVFRKALDRCWAAFRPLLPHDLPATMFAADDSAEAGLLNQTGSTQPALFSLGYALGAMWQSWGVRPDVVAGHSIGELTAMCVAGGLSLEDAARVVAARGRLMQALPAGGAMTAVMASEARVLEALAGRAGAVSIAALNGRAQTVISGEAAAVTAISSALSAEGVKTKPLVVSHAFHSPLMMPMLAEYGSVLRSVTLGRPSIPFVSTVLGRAADTELASPEYWLRNVMDPVRFTDGMAALDALGASIFVEMGPQPVLLGLGRQFLAADDADARLWLPSIKRDGAAWPMLLDSLGQLFAAGIDIDWRGFDAPYGRRRVTVPAYPFGGKEHWITLGPVVSSSAPLAPEQPAHGAAAYDIAWRELRGAGAEPVVADGHWLVFGGQDGLGEAAASLLETRGARCTLVPPAVADPSGWERVLAQAAAAPAGLRGVLYLRALDTTPASGSDLAAAATSRLEESASLMRVLARLKKATSHHPPLWIVTRGAVAAGHHAGPVDPVQSAVWGAGRSFALEHPECWGGLVDLAPADASKSAADLVDTVLSADVEDQIAIRPDGRFVPRLERHDSRPVPAVAIDREGTWLVTGGPGTLGLHTAHWLVARGARHILLTSRQGIEAPGAEAAVRGLEAVGASVTVVAADLGDPEGVDAVLRSIPAGAPLSGIFHAAGIDDTTSILDLQPGDIDRVMAAKAAGAWLLHERTRHLPLRAFVCFSSMASVLGSAGRMPYAAANAFLDGLAHERRRLGLAALSINWGPWAGGGMATDAALRQYARAGNRGLAAEQAVQRMEALMAGDAVQALVVDIDWRVFRTVFEARRSRPLIQGLDAEAPSAVEAPAGAAARLPWIARLADLPVERRLEEITALLRGEIAQTLGFESPADVALDRPFRDMGMDSLMSADFAQRLQKRVGIRSTALVFEQPSVQLLAPCLLATLERSDALASPAPAVAGATLVAGSFMTAAVSSSPGLSEGTLGLTRPSEPEDRIEGYRPGIEDEVCEFQRVAWPSRRADWLAPRWRWMFVESARRLNQAPLIWLHRHNDVIVGHNGAIPVRLQIGLDERTTAWLVDTMVLAEYRSQAVGARLMVQAHEDLPFALSLGQTDQMRAIQLRLGWEQVAPLQTAQLLLRPERVLRGKLPAAASLAAGLALRASAAVRRAGRRSGGTSREIGRFEPCHDAIWEAMSKDVTCAVRRDASYLNWKYVDQPGQDFLRLEVTAENGSRGLVILMFRDPDDAYAYRRASIVDVVAPLSDAALMRTLLDTAAGAAMDRGADAVWCLHIGPMLTEALGRAGYRIRKPSRYLLVRPGPLDGATRSNLLSPDGWLVTQGDSDIDRPW